MTPKKRKSLVKQLVRELIKFEDQRDFISNRIVELEKELDKCLECSSCKINIIPEIAAEKKLIDRNFQPLQITSANVNDSLVKEIEESSKEDCRDNKTKIGS